MLLTGDAIKQIDGKGRFQLPAKTREALDAGSGGRTEAGTSIAVLNYGDHLDGHLRLYPIAPWEEQLALIMAMDDGTDERLLNEHVYISQHQHIESDKEGRFVLPQRFRQKLGVDEGDVLLLGKGKYLQIWKPEYHAATEGARVKAKLAAYGPGFDPIRLAKKPGG